MIHMKRNTNASRKVSILHHPSNIVIEAPLFITDGYIIFNNDLEMIIFHIGY